MTVREDHVLPLVTKFFAERVLGPQRTLFLRQTTPEDPRISGTASKRAALRKQIAALHQAQKNLMKELSGYQPIGDEEIDAEWRKALQQQFAQVATERRAKEQELQALPHEPASEGPGDVSLLEQLPVHTGDLLALPEDLQRQLYDAFHLQIRYDQPKHQVTLRVTVSAATVDSLRSKITSVVAAAEQQKPPKSEQTLEADAVALASRVVSHVVGAPGGTHRASATISDLRQRAPVEIEYRYVLPSK